MSIKVKKTQDQVRKITLKHNDTVLVRKWEGMTKEEREAIEKSVRSKSLRQRLQGVTLIFVDEFSDLRTLNEAQMRANGWVRKNG